MYASQWFLTLYAIYFNIDVVVRIWDIYLVEGKKTLFRIALSILKLCEKRLMQAELGDMFIIFREFRTSVDKELLIKQSLDYTFSKKTMNKYDTEYKSKTQNKEIAAICKLL
jgi:hypothetical protein